MALYFYYANLLLGEARKHYKLSQLTSDPLIKNGHLEIVLALWVAAEIMRREGRQQWRDFPKSEKKRLLRLRPLK